MFTFKVTIKYKYVLLLLVLCVTIGFAYLTGELGFIGGLSSAGNTWDLRVEKINVLSGSVEAPTPTITNNNSTINYSVSLTKPGEQYSFTFYIINYGTIDAMFEKVTNVALVNGEESEIPSYIEYSIKYSDGKDIEENQIIQAKSVEQFKVVVKYKETLEFEDLTSDTFDGTLKLSISYKQADKNAQKVRISNVCATNRYNASSVPEGVVCKRAETLHTEMCFRTSDGCYADGYYLSGYKSTAEIIYGNCGTVGTLTVGDAFDCDVNNDGKYDEDTERFYYVSPRDTDEESEYVTLIYYNNVKDGVADPAFTVYYYYNSDYKHQEGPNDILPHLPSVEQWSNTKLNTNMTRQITNSSGGTAVGYNSQTGQYDKYNLPEYTYTDRAARLVTFQEIKAGCGSSLYLKNNCLFLGENTTYAVNNNRKYRWWLENVRDTYSSYYFEVQRYELSTASIGYNSVNAVRPAIEVKKTDISY